MKTRISSKIAVHAHRKGSASRRRRRPQPRRPREQRPVKHYTKAQVERFFAAIPEENVRDLLLFDLTYRHGLRRGEAALIELDDVQGEQIWIARLKGGEGHWHPLHRRTKQLLRAHKDIESTAIYFQVMPERVAVKYRMLLRSRMLAGTGSRVPPRRNVPQRKQLAQQGEVT